MMRPVHALLLSLAAVSAATSAERGMRHSSGVTDDEMPCTHESEAAAGLMAVLNEHFQRSSEMLQSSLHFGEADDVVRIVLIEQKDPALERKTACLKAVEKIHEQDELQQQTETLMRYIRSTFDMVSLRVWGGVSCEDLDRPELVEQCNLVLRSEGVVQKYLQEGKTDDQVCDIMSAVSDLDVTDNLSCQLCQRFVQMVDQALSQEVQQVQQVREIIGELCMASDSLCHTFPTNYDAIVDWVKDGTESLVVCSRLAMCSAESGINSL